MLHELHVLRQAADGRAALAVERDGEELAVAAGRDEGAEGLALEEADAGEAALREASCAVVEVAGRHGGRRRVLGGERGDLRRSWDCCCGVWCELCVRVCGAMSEGR